MKGQTNLLHDLVSIDVFKLGAFELQTGPISPFYVDLRHVPSYPKIFNSAIRSIYAKKEQLGLQIDAICGVPYAALPFAAGVCSHNEIPLIIRRQKTKDYGTRKQVEGVVTKGANCLVIEDTVVSGTSIYETVLDLRNAGFNVTDCICILDRLQGASKNLEKEGIKLHCLYDFNDIFSCYCAMNVVDESVVQNVYDYVQSNVYTIVAKV